MSYLQMLEELGTYTQSCLYGRALLVHDLISLLCRNSFKLLQRDSNVGSTIHNESNSTTPTAHDWL